VRTFASLFLTLLLTVTAAAAEHPPPQSASRQEVLQLLRRARIVDGRTQIMSAEWRDDFGRWKVVLRPPRGDVTCWLVDRRARTYVQLRKD